MYCTPKNTVCVKTRKYKLRHFMGGMVDKSPINLFLWGENFKILVQKDWIWNTYLH